ncbi:MAG: hypothetical protein EBR82_26585 [Caulobacteraceae bacterium]|nr:hypothetical protein [Caulobacteraceae bacterium]
MAIYSVEIREIYEIKVKDGENWADVLDKAKELYYKEGVEIDQVTLFSSDFDVIDIESEPTDLCSDHQIELRHCDFCK